ncbi:MAG: MAPEG family protein [Lysobacteraceae bacterium]
MSPALALPAAVTLLTVVLMFATAIAVGRARGVHGVAAPATTGHPAFERAFRVQMNTLEQAAMFLPALWVAALWGDPRWAAGFGAAWLLGRVWYAIAYLGAAERRGGGFVVGLLALVALVVQGGWGIVGAARGG